MSPTAAQKAAERAARSTGPATPPPPAAPVERPDDDRHLGPAAGEAASLDRIRCGVDLTQRHRRQLRRKQDDLADDLGEPRITQQDVLEQLVILLLSDQTTYDKVKAALRGPR